MKYFEYDGLEWELIEEISFNSNEDLHPSFIFAKSEYMRLSIGFTHSKRYNKLDTIPLKNNPNPNDKKQTNFNKTIQRQHARTYRRQDMLKSGWTLSKEDKEKMLQHAFKQLGVTRVYEELQDTYLDIKVQIDKGEKVRMDKQEEMIELKVPMVCTKFVGASAGNEYVYTNKDGKEFFGARVVLQDEDFEFGQSLSDLSQDKRELLNKSIWIPCECARVDIDAKGKPKIVAVDEQFVDKIKDRYRDVLGKEMQVEKSKKSDGRRDKNILIDRYRDTVDWFDNNADLTKDIEHSKKMIAKHYAEDKEFAQYGASEELIGYLPSYMVDKHFGRIQEFEDILDKQNQIENDNSSDKNSDGKGYTIAGKASDGKIVIIAEVNYKNALEEEKDKQEEKGRDKEDKEEDDRSR